MQKVITKVNQRVRFLAIILRFLDKKAILTLASALYNHILTMRVALGIMVF